jgi:valyl-tRNA synthetase
MNDTYDPSLIESHWYNTWNEAGHFVPQGQGESFCLMLPPPNVTGSLHMGHAMESALMDCLIRYHRMRGDNTHWQVGTDHAGIATQMVVERQLEQAGQNRRAMGREKFIDAVWAWKESSGSTIVNQFKRMGISADWTRERFTMDPGLSTAVQEVFIRLYEEGLIYRGQRLVNWDTKLKTAVSDLEVEHQDTDTFLWHLRYPVVGSDEVIIVATTRPETMLGDVAVAVHPEDPRYQPLIGKMLAHPLTGRTIPLIGDHTVDPSFGTGCVKITPAHDFNDYEMGLRHGLPMITVIDFDGNLNQSVPPAYQGLERFEARKKIVADLESQGFIEKIEPYKTKRPIGDRSNTVLEPLLTDQWYVKVAPLAEVAVAAVEKGEIEFVPAQWTNTYYAWMRDIKDWCISRQLWWGHRVPAWYDTAGKIYVGRSEEDVRQKYKLSADLPLHQDSDVLDTWFSSALWPFSTLGWPENTADFQTYYPTSVLICGFDIIFFWVARMIMMGCKFTGKPPFKQIYIHGLLCDHEGKKMSKSKGNVIDPIDLIDGIDLEGLVKKRTMGLMQPQMAAGIEKDTRKNYPEGIPSFGTDALRFTFCSLPATQRHINFDLARVGGYRNFCNKLWNAARYVFMNMEGKSLPDRSDCQFSLPDRYILSRLQKTIETTRTALDTFRFDLATQALYDFVWGEFCDWYLELSKPLLQHEDTRVQNAARFTLIQALDSILRLLHPMIPFITEEIWQKLASYTRPALPSIMLMDYPSVNADWVDPASEKDMEWVKSFILALRNIRGEMNLAPKLALPVLIKQATPDDQLRYQEHKPLIHKLANLSGVEFIAAETALPLSASAVLGSLELFVPLEGLIDKKAENARLQKQIDKLEKETQMLSGKLANEGYLARAPQELVERDKARVAELEATLNKLKEQQKQFA